MNSIEASISKILEHHVEMFDVPGSDQLCGSIWFTGWKAVPASVDHIAQLCWMPPASLVREKSEKADRFFVVQLPDMQVGEKRFSDDDSRLFVEYAGPVITPYHSREQMKELFKKAMIVLVSYVISVEPAWLLDALKSGDHFYDKRPIPKPKAGDGE
jgi:hypothetical protein